MKNRRHSRQNVIPESGVFFSSQGKRAGIRKADVRVSKLAERDTRGSGEEKGYDRQELIGIELMNWSIERNTRKSPNE
jgi:hypothetical protein